VLAKMDIYMMEPVINVQHVQLPIVEHVPKVLLLLVIHVLMDIEFGLIQKILLLLVKHVPQIVLSVLVKEKPVLSVWIPIT